MFDWKFLVQLFYLVSMTTAWHGHRRAGSRHNEKQRVQSASNKPHQRRDLTPRHFGHAAKSSDPEWDWLDSDLDDPFLSSIFSIGPRRQKRRPWWQGPNVCEETKENYQNATDTETDILGYSLVQRCDESETEYKCHLEEWNRYGKREVIVVYECCHGYGRDKGDFGCPKKIDTKNLVETARDLGLTEFLQALKMLELTDRMRTGNFTVFAPVDGAFGLDTDLVTAEGKLITPEGSKILQDAPAAFEVSEPSLERTIQALQGAILGHMTPGPLRSSSLEDEQVLETGHLEGSTIRINYFGRPARHLMTANCIPVISRDNIATNGVIHTVEKALRPVTETLLDLVVAREDLTFLKTVLATAEYVPKLEKDGKLTLLAPTNGAFQKMSRRLRERLLSGDKKCIQSVLRNYILPNVVCSAAFQSNSRTINLLHKYVNVTRTGDGKFFVNDAQVVSKDIMGFNGVMHIVDDVLIPEEALDFLDVLERQGLTELIPLVEMAGLVPTLQSAKNMTFFAPTNEAIKKMSVGLKSQLISDTDLLKKVLTFHLSPSLPHDFHIHNNQLIPSIEGRRLRLNSYYGGPFYHVVRTVQCAPILGQTHTCNGNLRLISQVMIPPNGNVLDVLAAEKRFSTFVSYLKRADLSHALEGEGPFTVLAPNNRAFKKVDRRAMEHLLEKPEQLANLVKTHVIRDNLCCARFSRGMWFGGDRIRAMSGAVHRISLNRHGDPVVSNVKVAKCDKTASNGNILEMNRVLLQEEPRRRSHFRRHFNRNHRRRMFHF